MPKRLTKTILVWLSGAIFLGCGIHSAPKGNLSQSSPPLVVVPRTKPTNSVSSGMSANPLESTNVLRVFKARGVIRELPAEGSSLVVRHEEIPGFMPSMTMEFDVREPSDLRGLRAGDTIAFVVKATERESWIEGIRLMGTNEVASLPPPDPSPASLLHIAQLKPGDQMPDVELLAEDGRTIKLSDFTGRTLAFTFIFTRCPLPDFCPRMNRHFSRARDLLRQTPDSPANWQFLSVSFDPDFDRPNVLARYASRFRGPDPDRWLFAAVPTNIMASLSAQLDFRLANRGGNFMHNLRTVVLDPQRRVFRQFDGNKWKAEELMEAIVRAAQETK